MIDGKEERTKKKALYRRINRKDKTKNERKIAHKHMQREIERTIFGQSVQRTVKNQIYLYTRS